MEVNDGEPSISTELFLGKAFTKIKKKNAGETHKAVLVKHYINKIAAQDVKNVAARSSEFSLIS